MKKKNTITIKIALSLALAVPLMLTVGCAHLAESDVVDPAVHGAWAGEGRFYDRDLNEEYGAFAVAFEIHPDGTVSGTVGNATMTDGVIKSGPEDFLIEAALIGTVVANGSLPDEHTDNVVFILEPPGADATNGDFHLKTNLAFDFSMRAGALTLTRSS